MKPCHHIRKNDRLIVMTPNVLIVIGTKKLFSEMIHHLRMSASDFHVVFLSFISIQDAATAKIYEGDSDL